MCGEWLDTYICRGRTSGRRPRELDVHHHQASQFFTFSGSLYSAFHCLLLCALLLVLQGDAAEMPASKFRGLVSAMYPFSDERLCVCNIISTTYLLTRLHYCCWWIRKDMAIVEWCVVLFLLSLLFACCCFLHYWRVVILTALQATTTVVYFLCCVCSSECTDWFQWLFLVERGTGRN